MKLNNKGFAISTVMYMILIAGVILIVLTLSILSARKLILDKIRNEASDSIYNVYDITYRQVLESLKEEAINYGINNSITKESIKLKDINSTIDDEILQGYNLYDKYLTINKVNDSYDVYLGKANTITDIKSDLSPFIDIIDYKIYGNSIQDGNPSPDEPKNIKSVGHIPNLLLPFTASRTSGLASIVKDTQYVTFNGINTSVNGSGRTNFKAQTPKVTLKSGHTYYFRAFKLDGIATKTTDNTESSVIPYLNDLSGDIKLFGKNTLTSVTATTTPSNDVVVYPGFNTTGKTTYDNYKVGAILSEWKIDEYDPTYDKYKIPIRLNNVSGGNTKLNIYLDEPLRKVGEYSDYISFKDSKVVRNVSELVLTGYEDNWEYLPNNNKVMRLNLSSNQLVSSSINLTDQMNTHFEINLIKATDNVAGTDVYYSSSLNGTYFRIRDISRFSNDTEVKEFLQNAYDLGTPVTHYYGKNTSSEESITLPNISLGEYNHITIDTEVQPSKVEFTVIEKIKKI